MRARGQKRVRNAETEYRLFRRALSHLRDELSTVVQFRLPIEDMTAVWSRLFALYGFHRLTRESQGYLRGVYDETWKRAWFDAEWRLVWRGREYSSDPRSLAPSTDAIETGTWCEITHGRHVWAGTEKPFTRNPEPTEIGARISK